MSAWVSEASGSVEAVFARQATKPSGRTRTAPSVPVPYSSSNRPASSASGPSPPTRKASSATLEPRRDVRAAALAPGLAVAPGKQDKAAAEEVEQRDVIAVARHDEVRRTRAGTRRRRERVLDHRAVVAGSRTTAVGAVAVAELDGGLRDDRLEVLLPELGREPQDVTRVRLLDRELGDGAPLGVVVSEQPGPGRPVEDGRELPGEVVPILHARVAAEAAGRRHVVRGVADDEDTPVLQRRRPLGTGVPALDVLDLDRDLRISERLAHVLDAALLRGVRPQVGRAHAVLVDRRVDDEEAGVPCLREAEEP